VVEVVLGKDERREGDFRCALLLSRLTSVCACFDVPPCAADGGAGAGADAVPTAADGGLHLTLNSAPSSFDTSLTASSAMPSARISPFRAKQ
jgi:hypothetical protein